MAIECLAGIVAGGGETQGVAVSETNQVQPYVLAVLLCDTIITEAGTSKKTLVGLFDRVMAPAYPVLHRFGVYVKLTDAQGPYQMRLEYVDISGDRVLEWFEFPIEAADRLTPTELTLTITAPIPTAGGYEFRLYANNSYLVRAPFEATPIEVPGGQAP